MPTDTRTCGELSCDECNERYAAVCNQLTQLRAENEYLKSEWDALDESRIAFVKEAYKLLGIEDDGEYRWKWVLLGIHSLKEERDGFEALLKACLREVPCSYIPGHTITRLPELIRGLAIECREQNDGREKAEESLDEAVKLLDGWGEGRQYVRTDTTIFLSRLRAGQEQTPAREGGE